MESNIIGCIYYSVILVLIVSMDITTSWTQETSTGAGTSSLDLNSTQTVIISTTAIINPTASTLKDNTTAVINSTNILRDETTAIINSSIVSITNRTLTTIEYTSQSYISSPTSHGSTQPISGSDTVVCQVYDLNSLLQSLQVNCTLVNFTFGECYCLVDDYCCLSLDNCCPDKCTCIEKSTSITLDEDLIITISVAGFLLLMMCTFVIAYFVRHATSKKYQKQLKPTISASSNSSGVAAALTTASAAAAPTTATITAGRATAATTVTPSARMNSHWGQEWWDYSPPSILTTNQPYRPQQQQHMLW